MTDPIAHENDPSGEVAGSDVMFVDAEAPQPAGPVTASPSVLPAKSPPARERFAWLLTSVTFLALMSFFLPYTVEKMTYSYARGRQRALYETAGAQLKNVSLKDMSDACQLVANRVGPSVVHITSTQVEAAKASKGPTPWRHPATSQGSGVVVDKQGYVITNAHVIQGCTNIRVKLSDGRNLAASVIGVDRLTDIAVLKVDAHDLLPAEWGDSDALEVGGLVWALGSPLGLQRSVTFGILSGKNRSFSAEQRYGIPNSSEIAADSPYHNFLQTDAAVNPGNSGGPLVDSQGRVVGINTAIVGEAYQGISFAIPSSIARPIYERIRASGRVERGWLGVDPDDITPDLAQRLGLPEPAGALVVEVVSNLDGAASPAQKAGILAGDVIVQWDGQKVSNSTDLFSLVALTSVGTAVDVVVVRGGQPVTLSVTVTARPE